MNTFIDLLFILLSAIAAGSTVLLVGALGEMRPRGPSPRGVDSLQFSVGVSLW